ncbi:MAG: hypothetical protein KKB50_07230 [Planctomycetes bacterium]|nr:hypothetical protein [Planctomycetota bacterium]
MTRQNMAPLVEYLQGRKVRYYSGYPSALYLLATYMREQGIRLQAGPAIVFTGAETLLAHQRELIGSVLGCEVAEYYGAAEQGAHVSECERHGCHVDMELGIIEFLPVPGGSSRLRRIVSSGFRNPVMPLLRYNMGDLATLSAGKACLCGRAAPMVERIDGRIESYIITPDGRQLGRLDFLFKESQSIREAQLIQDAADHLTVKVVRGAGYAAADEAALQKDLRAYLGEQIRIEIEYPAEIPRDANGKFRQIVSKVFQDRYGSVSGTAGAEAADGLTSEDER